MPDAEAGQVFYADYAEAAGFCNEAWKAIYQYVLALAHGAGNEVFYYGDRMRKPGVALCSCNDGIRPVILKLEVADTKSIIDVYADKENSIFSLLGKTEDSDKFFPLRMQGFEIPASPKTECILL